jgi:hypothetical protein
MRSTDLLRRPKVTYASLLTLPGAGSPVADPQVAMQVEIATKYAGYIDRQHDEIARHLALESAQLPADLDYRSVRGLSTEAQQKLNLHKPETIGQAARISGITPAAISLLLVHLKGSKARARHAGAVRMTEAAITATHDADLAAGIASLGLALDSGQRAQLAAYLALLAKWNKTYNLTAIREPARMVTHHLLDALSVVPHLPAVASVRILDVGSGGGVPGIPLAIARPDAHVVMIDSNHKKAAFLLQAAIESDSATRNRTRCASKISRQRSPSTS